MLVEETPVRNPGTQSVRNKRGLVDVLAYWLKHLFGTVDVRDVKRLAAVCDELRAFESRMLHAADHRLIYLRTLDEVTAGPSGRVV